MSHTALIDALYGEMGPKLEERQVEALYFDVEHPLCRVLAEMELAGFQVDAGMLRSFGETLTAAIETLEQRIYSYAGQFNINSPKQLGEVLFERLGLPSYKKTKTGYSTSAEVLEKLRGAHPIVGEVLEYRQYAKLKSTYVDGLLKVISPDGRVRTSFQMTVTATGRLSSTEPNLQNIPPDGAGQRAAADVRGGAGGRSWWTRTTARSSCGSWPTSPGTRPWATPFAPGRISTPSPPPTYLLCRWRT